MEKEKVSYFSAIRYRKEKAVEIEDTLAEEIPIAFEYNGIPYTVRLATPSDIEDLALGLSLTEEIIKTPSDLLHYEVWEEQNGFRVVLEVNESCFNKVKEKKLKIKVNERQKMFFLLTDFFF